MTPVGELIARRARTDGERIALITPAREWTYRDLDTAIDTIAANLAAHRVTQGERVALLARNGAEYIATFYAAARLGAMLVGINWRLAAPEIEHILGDAAPRVLVCAEEFAATAATAAAASATEVVALERLASTSASTNANTGTITSASIGATRAAYPTNLPPDTPLALCYTSGTTGRPKGAILTHANLLAAARTIEATVDYRLHDVSLIATPLFHVGGLSFATLFPLRGASVVVAPAWVPDDIAAAIAAHRVNHFFAVPAMLDTLLPALPSTASSHLRWIMTGAAPLPERLIHAYSERGIALLQSYGATETAGPATCMDASAIRTKPRSIGRPFLGTDVRIVDAKGETGIGELVVRGGHIFTGYWNNAAATREAITDDGWLVTGDVGYRDADGYFYLVDRKKEVIISGGENVYPAEVEQVLAEHPAVREVAVVGVGDKRWGEVVCAVVVAREGMRVALDDVREFCRARLASYKLPSRLVVSAAALPRNATGKVVRDAVKRAAGAA